MKYLTMSVMMLHTAKRLSEHKDTFLFFMSLCGFFYLAYLLVHYEAKELPPNAVPIGMIRTEDTVKRLFSKSLKWHAIRDVETVYQGDSLYTPEGTTAVVHLKGKGKFLLQPRSLIQFEQIGGEQLDLVLLQGEFEMKKKGTKIKVSGQDTRVNISKQQINVNSTSKKEDVKVSVGGEGHVVTSEAGDRVKIEMPEEEEFEIADAKPVSGDVDSKLSNELRWESDTWGEEIGQPVKTITLPKETLESPEISSEPLGASGAASPVLKSLPSVNAQGFDAVGTSRLAHLDFEEMKLEREVNFDTDRIDKEGEAAELNLDEIAEVIEAQAKADEQALSEKKLAADTQPKESETIADAKENLFEQIALLEESQENQKAEEITALDLLPGDKNIGAEVEPDKTLQSVEESKEVEKKADQTEVAKKPPETTTEVEIEESEPSDTLWKEALSKVMDTQDAVEEDSNDVLAKQLGEQQKEADAMAEEQGSDEALSPDDLGNEQTSQVDDETESLNNKKFAKAYDEQLLEPLDERLQKRLQEAEKLGDETFDALKKAQETKAEEPLNTDALDTKKVEATSSKEEDDSLLADDSLLELPVTEKESMEIAAASRPAPKESEPIKAAAPSDKFESLEELDLSVPDEPTVAEESQQVAMTSEQISPSSSETQETVTVEAEIDRTLYLSAAPQVEFTAIDATDVTTSSTAKFVSKPSYGIEFGGQYTLTEKIDLGAGVKVSFISFEVPSGKTLSTPSSMLSFRLSPIYHYSRSLRLGGTLGFGQLLSFRSTSNSALLLENNFAFKFLAELVYNFLNYGNYFLDLNAGGGLLLPMANDNYDLSMGYLGYGKLSVGYLMHPLTIKAALSYKYIAQDTTIATQKTQVGGLEIWIVYSFGDDQAE